MSALDVLIARSEEALAHLKALYGRNRHHAAGFERDLEWLEGLENAIEDARAERDVLISGKPKAALVVDGAVGLYSDYPLNIEILKINRSTDPEGETIYISDAAIVDPRRVECLFQAAERFWSGDDLDREPKIRRR